MKRQRFDENELANLLLNAYGIDVRLWVVNDGLFEGMVFDSNTSNEQWQPLISDHPSPNPTGVEA